MHVLNVWISRKLKFHLNYDFQSQIWNNPVRNEINSAVYALVIYTVHSCQVDIQVT